MVVLKSKGEIELMDHANSIVQSVLDEMERMIAPGVSTLDLDRRAEAMIREASGVPAFLGYNGFPASLCTSINDVIVHGIPSDKEVLEEGDIIGVDCGVFYKGYCGDSARTFAVGSVSSEARRLLDTTRVSLEHAIQAVQPGGHLHDIGHAVESHVEEAGFAVVREFVGHGIGTAMHEEPQVPNFGSKGTGRRLKPGMVLAIEPMVNVGGPGVKVDADGWTARTTDGSLSAHFEFSVAVTEQGPQVLGVARDAAAATA